MPVTTNPSGRTGLLRRVVARAARELAQRWWRTTVRPAGAGSTDPVRVRVRVWPPGRTRRYLLDGTAAGPRQRGGSLRLVLPDAAALERLAAAGLLTGTVRRLDLVLAAPPAWELAGIRPPRLGTAAAGFHWRRRGRRLRVRLRWWRPYDVGSALAAARAAVQRPRPWDQASGPLPGAGVPAAPAAPAGHPYGRVLAGAAQQYRLDRAPGRPPMLRDPGGAVVWRAGAPLPGTLAKYAVVSVDPPAGDLPAGELVAGEPALGAALATLAGCGLVFAATDSRVRAALDRLGLVTVADPAAVADLPGYALSVAAARQAAIAGDPLLRRTTLAAGGTTPGGNGSAVPLPAVTAVVASMRPGQLDPLFGYLARQTYPALEVVVGLHGYQLPEPEQRRLRQAAGCPVRFVALPGSLPFGAVLGRLSRMADGELLTKLDDDDHYGPHHVTDLVLAWRTTGADLVAKGARFVHFPELAETVDRAWAAPEVFDVTPAGGTLLLSRGTLAAAGGWSHAPRHVDADLLTRIRSAGGLVYRTHALEYVYVRRAIGHTFAAAPDELRAQGERTYPGLPDAIINPDPFRDAYQEPTHADGRHPRGGVLR